MPSIKKIRLGDILLAQGYINEDQLKTALANHKKTKQRLGDYLVDTGMVADEDIARALHIQLGIELVELRGIKIPENVISSVSGTVLRRHNVLPIGYADDS
ncbi:MAG: type II secretion system protein GspE, partial [Oscillospiraceae bacterium]